MGMRWLWVAFIIFAAAAVPADYAAAEGLTFTTVGSLDKAYEAVVLDYVWGFWQYNLLANCEQAEIRRVYSKGQALSQCRNWLSKNAKSSSNAVS